jgi:hypothetical protein
MANGDDRNKICDKLDEIKKVKEEVFDLVEMIKNFCNNYPRIEFPTSLPSALNPKQAVIEFLRDLLAVLNGVDFEKIKNALVNWLTIEVIPLEADLKVNLAVSIKECFACKINPKIPGWLFQTTTGTTYETTLIDPITNQQSTSGEGLGINIPIHLLTLGTCFLRVHPDSNGGKLLYGDNNDMNRFLHEVIQNNGTTIPWIHPETNQTICHMTYYEDNPYAFTNSSTGEGYQDENHSQMVINMKIDDYYKDKTFFTFIDDYLNSQIPLYDSEKIIPTAIDFIFGTITKEITLPPDCIQNSVMLNKMYQNIYDSDDEEEIVTDSTYFEFSDLEIKNIKEEVIQKQEGVSYYTNCCQRASSSIPFSLVSKINEDLITQKGNKEKTAEVLQKSLDDLSNASIRGINSGDRLQGLKEFFHKLLEAISIALARLTFSPKIMFLVLTMYYMCNAQLNFKSLNDIIRSLKCVIKDLIKELLRKLIFEFLLPLILDALKRFIVCYVSLKIKEVWENYGKTQLSLIKPPWLDKAVDIAEQALGKGDQIVERASGVVNNVNDFNIGSNNLTIDMSKKEGKNGKFCG